MSLLVRLTDVSDIVVSLDRPAEAAAVVNDLLDKRASAGSRRGASPGPAPSPRRGPDGEDGDPC